jgi:hypothetical protein
MSIFTDDVIENIAQTKGKMSSHEMQHWRAIIQRVINIIEDMDKMAVLLGGVPDLFETTVTIIENDVNMTYGKCKEMLIAYAQKVVNESHDSSERINAVLTSSSTSSSNSSNSGLSNVANSSNSNANSYCDHCNRNGHSNAACWILHPNLNPQGTQ